MKFVIFGLTVSSSWGNGHATLWRGLIKALARRGHEVAFFEKDVPYYSSTRDLHYLHGAKLVLYRDWDGVMREARRELADAHVAIVTSYCPDGKAATELLSSSPVHLKCFYDLDTPITLEQVRNGNPPAYLPRNGLRDFDLVFSFTGGAALDLLQADLGAKRVLPLYGHVDPEFHRPVASQPQYTCDLSYLGTYAADRQEVLERLFIEPARKMPNRKFIIGGSLYPQDFPWTRNIHFVRHMPPGEHPAFFCSSRLTLNTTRKAMAQMGYCPSGRLFESAACQTPVITDDWEGLGAFFVPGKEILVAHNSDDVRHALKLPAEKLRRIGAAARERVLREHTSAHRAQELEAAVSEMLSIEPHSSEQARIAANLEAEAGDEYMMEE
jgi:spore maturation protein CgeB